MAFDPDAYLAEKSKPVSSGGGFDPDAYLSDKGVAATPGAIQPPQSPGVMGALGGIASGAVSNMVDIGRGAIAGSISVPGELSKLAQKGANLYETKVMGREPVWSEKTWMPEFASTVKNIPRFGAAETPQSRGFETMGSVVAPFPGAGAVKSAQKAVRTGKDIAAPIMDTLRGVPVSAARKEALDATKNALQGESSKLGRTAVNKAAEASQGESIATAVQRNLDQIAERGGRPTLDVIGETSRKAVTGAYDAAETARREGTKGLYQKAEEAAIARERDGARIDVSSVTPKVEALLEKAGNIPELQGKLGKLLNAVTGAPAKEAVAAPIGVGKVSSRVVPPKVGATPREGLTYAELDLTNKYLKDIAYSGEMQGYDSIVRRAALDLSKNLDKAIASFVPEHAAAAAKYAELSAPLESQATRIGRAIAGTEGGIKGESYSKIPAQMLPQRLFGTKDGIELVVDAIAGGKHGAARVAAQKQVDQLVEHWIMETARGATGATGEAAAKAIQTPQMAATLQAVPSVAKKLGSQFESEARMARMGEQAVAGAKGAAGEAEIAAKAKARIDKAIAQAEVDMAHGSQRDAYDGYVAALRQSMISDPEKYKAAIGLIERAGNLEAKTQKARKIAMSIAGLAGVAGAAKVGVQVPGMMQ